MASAEFTEESKQKRPNVQVGDPFMEKLLLEACLEAMQTGAIVGIQDMGAAGLTCSTCEMGSRGGVGIEIELDRVPQRETGMTPYEIMLSESQERMLLVADKGREDEVFAVFRKWGLEAVEIGAVTGDGKLRVRHHGEVVAEIPNRELADEAPLYDRPHTHAAARRADAAAGAAAKRDLQADAAQRCWRRPISVPSAGSGSSTTTRCAPIRWPARSARRGHRAHQGDRHFGGHVARRQRALLLSFAARGRASWRWRSAAAISRRWARGRWRPPTA